MKLRNNRAGFTMMEILIVLAIIGGLFAWLAPRVTGNLQKKNVQEAKMRMGELLEKLNMYYTDCGKYPQSLQALVQNDGSCSNWGPEAYMKKLPKDPWGNEYQYSMVGGDPVIKSFGKDGQEGGEGYNKDISTQEEEEK